MTQYRTKGYRTVIFGTYQRKYGIVRYGNAEIRVGGVQYVTVLYRAVREYRTNVLSYCILCETGVRIYIIIRIPMSVSCIGNSSYFLSRSCMLSMPRLLSLKCVKLCELRWRRGSDDLRGDMTTGLLTVDAMCLLLWVE